MMIVVAEVPSMEMDATVERRLRGTSSSSWKSVIFQDCIQSIVSLFFLENKTKRPYVRNKIHFHLAFLYK